MKLNAMFMKKAPIIGEKKKNPLKDFHPFDNNTFVLVFSCLAAVGIWFMMMDAEMAGRGATVTNVPIQIELSTTAQEAGVRIWDQSFSSTDVSVTGNTVVTSKLTTEDIGVVASLDPSLNMLTGNSMQQATVTLRAFKKGNTLADYEVKGVSPSELVLTYDKYKEIQLSVDNQVKYEAAEGFYVPSTPMFSIDRVTISGPESEVNKVKSAALIYEFTDALTQSKAVSCKISLIDSNGDVIDNPASRHLTLSDDTVDISVQVTSRKTVTIKPDIRNLPASFKEDRIKIEPQSIDIVGDGNLISGYEDLTLATPINFYDVTPENNTFTLEIPILNGVTNISNAETVTITFNMNGYTVNDVKTENISVINAPEGKKVELITESLTIKTVGPAAVASKLTGESVFCTIDFSGITELKPRMEVPVSVKIMNADNCWVNGTYTAHVTVADDGASSAPTA